MRRRFIHTDLIGHRFVGIVVLAFLICSVVFFFQPFVQSAVADNGIWLNQGGLVGVLWYQANSSSNARFGINTPFESELYSDCLGQVGQIREVGTFDWGTELIFYLYDEASGQTWLSTDPTRCQVTALYGDTWVLYWDTNGDGNFQDYIFGVGRADVSDTDFKPNPDGFKFQNYPAIFTPLCFREAFGLSLQETWYEREFYSEHYKDGLGGQCGGMSSKSLDFYRNVSPNHQTYSKWLTQSLDNDIEVLQLKQLGTTWQREVNSEDGVVRNKDGSLKEPGGYPQRAYERILQNIRGGFGDPLVLGIWTDDGSSAHALVPYKVYDNPYAGVVMVYDPNRPGDPNVYVVFFKFNNYEWNFNFEAGKNYHGYSVDPRILTFPLSKYLDDTHIPGEHVPGKTNDLVYLASLGSGTELGITDSQGRRLGYQNGTYYDEIPDANQFINMGDTSAGVSSSYFLLTPQDLNLKLWSNSIGTGGMLIGDGAIGYFPHDLDTSTGNPNDFSLTPANGELKVSPSNDDADWSMKLGLTSIDRACEFSNTQAKAGEAYYFQAMDGGQAFSFKNSGSSKPYDLHLESNGQSFDKGSLSVSATDTDYVQCSNWNDLEHSTISLGIDHSSDGHIEETIILKQAAPSMTSISPSSGASGAEVAITGTSFGSSQDSSYVTFNGKKATGYTSWNDTQIKVAVPSEATTGPVQVTTAGGTSNGITFTVTEPPQHEPKVPITYPTWYLAEGTTDWGFSTYITIENPNGAALKANVTYMPTGKATKTETVSLPASSQTTLTNDHLVSVMGGVSDFSTKVECTDPTKTIAVDRTMTWTGPGALSPEAHSSVGVTSPAKTWYLPEGSSNWNFECWLLIQNPNAQTAHCQVTYMIEGQGPKTVDHEVPANSRASFDMSKDIGSHDASIKVESNVPVIPERAMYRNNRREGHDSIGTTTPATNYYLAEGTTAYGFTTYVLVQNPNSSPASVTLTYMTPSGAKPQAAITLPANSRKTIKVNDVAGMGNTDFSTKVTGSKPIIAERAMYWGAGTPLGEACHDSIGMDAPHKTFYLPDGQSSEGRETWTLVQNPNSTPVSVKVDYLTPSGTGNQTLTQTIPANSRKTFNMADKVPSGRASVQVTCLTAGKKIMVERAMYWNNRGAGTDTIGGYSD